MSTLAMARSIDFIEKWHDGDYVGCQFPIYDGHGNMIATIARDGSDPYYTVANLREYDVWGQIRAQGSLDAYGGPVMRYCGQLGHECDDESGLIYMRARYFEPLTGRFISEDSSRDGLNWFVYTANDPVNKVDSNGHFWWFYVGMILIGAIMAMATYAIFMVASGQQITWHGLGMAALLGAITGGLGALYGAFFAGAVVSAAAATEFMVAQIALRLGIACGAGIAGSIYGSIKGYIGRPSGLGKAVAGLLGEQFLVLSLVGGMDDD